LRQALRELAAAGRRGAGICFLFSFKNASHEKRGGEIAREIWQCFVTLSSDIYRSIGSMRERAPRRVNAYLGPRVSTYLERMSEALDRWA